MSWQRNSSPRSVRVDLKLCSNFQRDHCALNQATIPVVLVFFRRGTSVAVHVVSRPCNSRRKEGAVGLALVTQQCICVIVIQRASCWESCLSLVLSSCISVDAKGATKSKGLGRDPAAHGFKIQWLVCMQSEGVFHHRAWLPLQLWMGWFRTSEQPRHWEVSKQLIWPAECQEHAPRVDFDVRKLCGCISFIDRD